MIHLFCQIVIHLNSYLIVTAVFYRGINAQLNHVGLAPSTLKGEEKLASPTGIETVRYWYKKARFLVVTEVMLTIIDG